MRNCTRDEGGPFEAGSQVQVSSHRELMCSLPGIFFGSHLSARVPDRLLRPILATILVIVGVRMLQA